jgi:hypothetical protein
MAPAPIRAPTSDALTLRIRVNEGTKCMKKGRTHGPIEVAYSSLNRMFTRAPHPLGLPDREPGGPVCLDASLRGRGFRARREAWARRGAGRTFGGVRRAPDRCAGRRGPWGLVPPVGPPGVPRRAPRSSVPRFCACPLAPYRNARPNPARIGGQGASLLTGLYTRRARGIPRRWADSRAALRAQTQDRATKPNLSAPAIGESRDVDDVRGGMLPPRRAACRRSSSCSAL